MFCLCWSCEIITLSQATFGAIYMDLVTNAIIVENYLCTTDYYMDLQLNKRIVRNEIM